MLPLQLKDVLPRVVWQEWKTLIPFKLKPRSFGSTSPPKLVKRSLLVSISCLHRIHFLPFKQQTINHQLRGHPDLTAELPPSSHPHFSKKHKTTRLPQENCSPRKTGRHSSAHACRVRLTWTLPRYDSTKTMEYSSRHNKFGHSHF